MSQAINVKEKSFEAENDLSAKQYYFVEIGGSDGQIDLCDSASDFPLGVLQNKPKAGEAANVQFLGTAKVIAGGNVSAGAYVGTDGNGKAVAKTADKAIVRGIALESAVANDLFEILLIELSLSVTS